MTYDDPRGPHQRPGYGRGGAPDWAAELGKLRDLAGLFATNGPLSRPAPWAMGPDARLQDDLGPRPPRGGHRGHRGGRARRGEVRLAILGLLAEEERNGYQVIREIEERTAGRWRPSPGAVYPALSQLEDEGLIEPTDGTGKVFRLTEAGRAEVDRLGDAARPWERAAEDAAHRAHQEFGGQSELWVAYGQLGLALRAAAQVGDPHIARATVELLEETRRGVYRLLAAEPDERDDPDEVVEGVIED